MNKKNQTPTANPMKIFSDRIETQKIAAEQERKSNDPDYERELAMRSADINRAPKRKSKPDQE